MIAKIYLDGRKVFGNDPWDIEIADADMTFIEMLHSPEMYTPHHVLEWKYSSKELRQMNRYRKVSSDELIWVKEETHNHNKVIHKGEVERGNNISENRKGFKHSYISKNKISMKLKRRTISEFGRKFKEHFGFTYYDNHTLYKREHKWYKNHNKTCRWE